MNLEKGLYHDTPKGTASYNPSGFTPQEIEDLRFYRGDDIVKLLTGSPNTQAVVDSWLYIEDSPAFVNELLKAALNVYLDGGSIANIDKQELRNRGLISNCDSEVEVFC